MSVLDIAMSVADAAAARMPAATPTPTQLQRCRLISHRGEHDNIEVHENTLAAFRAACDAGVWGIECDIRFTADAVPVICHDTDPVRVFGRGEPVSTLTFAQLRRILPNIPSLAEVIASFAGKMHLMLEVKAEDWPRGERHAHALRDALSALTPVQDYHVLSLHTPMFDRLAFIPPQACLPVAELNVAAMSRYALQRGCAGIGGHYLLLGKRLQDSHARAGQQLGVGFPASRNCFYRQVARGIEWVFSNDAVLLESLRQRALRAQAG